MIINNIYGRFFRFSYVLLLVFMLLMQPFIWTQKNEAHAGNSGADAKTVSPQWTTEDITGAWEVVSRVYVTLREEETAAPDFVADIQALNTSLAEKRIIERFSDAVYNHFDSELGGENVIYDQSADALFVYHTGDPVIYQFTFAQYQNDALGDGAHDSQWAHVETTTQAHDPILGFEVEQVRYWDEQDDNESIAEVLYWVSSELPSWFYQLKDLGVPGYALKQSSSMTIEGHQLRVNKEAISIRPIDSAALLRAPEDSFNVVLWEEVREEKMAERHTHDLPMPDKQGAAQENAEISANRDDKSEVSLTEVERQQAGFLEMLMASNPKAYDAVSVFQGGLARVEQAGKTFYINTQGERLFDHQLDTVLTAQQRGCYQLNSFDEGVIAHYLVARDQKMGLVDPHTGQWLIEADYDYLEKRPCQILKSYKDGLVGLFSFEGKELVPTKYQDVRSFGFQNFFAVQQKGQWGVYEGGSRDLVIPTKFDQISYCGGCGSKPEYFYAKKDGHWGLVGFDGQLRLPFEYEFPQHRFMRGDQWVVNLQRDGQELLIHLGTGTHYFNKDYDDVLVLNDFMALKKGGRFALFNRAGQQLTDFELTGVYELDNYSGQNLYIEVAKEDKRAILDASGADVVPWQRAEYISRLRQDYFLVHHNKKGQVELRDLSGTVLVPAQYDGYSIEARKDESNEWVDTNVLKVHKGKLRGWYFADEGVLVEPTFDNIRYWAPEHAEHPYILVEKGGMSGLYKLDGTEVLPPVYDSLSLQLPELLSFKQDSGYGLINIRTGKELVPPRYAWIDPVKTDKIMRLRLPYEQQQEGESLYHWWDAAQQKMIELPFKEYEPLSQEGLWAVFKDGKSFLYDAQAQKIISAPYDLIGDASNGLIIVENDDKFGVINDKGKEIFPLDYDLALRNDSGFIALSRQNKKRFWETIYLRPDGEPMFSDPIRTWSSPDSYEAPLIRAAEQEIIVGAYDPVRRNDSFGIYDWQGTERFAPEYKTLFLYNDVPRYGAIKKNHVGLFDDQRNEVFPMILDGIYHADAPMHWGPIRDLAAGFPLLAYIDGRVDQRNKRHYFYIDKNGEVLPVVAHARIAFDEKEF